MFKIVAIAGPLRGKEFVLKEGANLIGRSEDLDISLASLTGISKKHAKLTIINDIVLLEDLNSSNGTFVEGNLVHKIELLHGNQFSLPDVIFQLIQVKEKIKYIKKEQEKDEELSEEKFFLKNQSQTENNLVQKVLKIFKFKLMPMIYGINKEYEWQHLFGILLFIYIFITISITIVPILRTNNSLLQKELAKRGISFANQIARVNAKALERKDLDNIDTAFIEKEQDVSFYELFDLEGRIVRPVSKLNEFLNDTFSIKARDWALKMGHKQTNALTIRLSNGEIGIAQKIMAYNPKNAQVETVGVIALKFAPEGLLSEASRNLNAWLEALSMAVLVSIIFFGMLYYLTTRPIHELNYHLEMAFHPKKIDLKASFLMKELGPLREKIQHLIHKIKDLESTISGEVSDIEEEPEYPYLEKMEELMKSISVPCLILNSEKNIHKISMAAEDLTGMRESSAQGMALVESVREKGFAATILELIEFSVSSNGQLQEGEYELGGMPHRIFVNTFIGKDQRPKGHLITFVKEV